MYQLKSDDSESLNQLLRAHIVDFNQAHFDTSRIPLGFKFVDKNQQVVAGIFAHVFGNWLQVSWLWCAPNARGQGLAKKLLDKVEKKGKSLGAVCAQLDTLDFQAKPFYEENGYQVKYQMNNYPLTGSRYFMEKTL